MKNEDLLSKSIMTADPSNDVLQPNRTYWLKSEISCIPACSFVRTDSDINVVRVSNILNILSSEQFQTQINSVLDDILDDDKKVFAYKGDVLEFTDGQIRYFDWKHPSQTDLGPNVVDWMHDSEMSALLGNVKKIIKFNNIYNTIGQSGKDGYGVRGRMTNVTDINLKGIQNLGVYMFVNSTKLSSVAGTDDLKNMWDGGNFENCQSLSSISIPNVDALRTRTFRNCSNLKTIDFSKRKSDGIPTLTPDALAGIHDDYRIIVPARLYNQWISSGNWASIDPIHFEKSEV